MHLWCWCCTHREIRGVESILFREYIKIVSLLGVNIIYSRDQIVFMHRIFYLRINFIGTRIFVKKFYICCHSVDGADFHLLIKMILGIRLHYSCCFWHLDPIFLHSVWVIPYDMIVEITSIAYSEFEIFIKNDFLARVSFELHLCHFDKYFGDFISIKGLINYKKDCHYSF